MAETKHTPTPWVPRYLDRISVPSDTDGTKSIAHFYSNLEDGTASETNRDFALRAVNCHDDLLEACKAAVESLEQLVKLNRIPENMAGLRVARAAILKATT